MTPEEIAKEITDQLWLDWPDVLDRDGTATRIAAAIRDAYERAAEACDKQIDQYTSTEQDYVIEQAAASIRALKEPPHER